jgi:hypothetical protein
MKKLIVCLALLCLSFAAAAADSPKDVQALIDRGDFSGAEAMLRQAVTEHPSSAKAHYVLAEVLAHEGNIGEAKTEANKAASLDPGTHFTDPAKFQAFQHKLDAALGPVQGARRPLASAGDADAPRAPAEGGHSSHIVGVVVVLAIVIGIIVLVRRRSAPQANAYPPVPPVNNVPPPDGGYGNGGYGSGPYAAPQPPRSGVGSAVAAGLGGVAAGVLLDEAFRSHGESGGMRSNDAFDAPSMPSDPTGQAYDDLRDEPIDMGNNDSSWDDSASGDSGSSDDDNSW